MRRDANARIVIKVDQGTRDLIRNPNAQYAPPPAPPLCLKILIYARNDDRNKLHFVLCVPDDDEKEIMVCMFEFAKDLINLQLTETELALICAVVLIDHCEYKSTIKLH